MRGEGMPRSGDRHHLNGGKHLALEPWRHPQRAHDPYRRSAAGHTRRDGRHHLRIDPQINRGELAREVGAQLHQRSQGEERIDAQRYRGFEPAVHLSGQTR